MHALGPIPNGMKAFMFKLPIFSSLKRSGSNFSGFGKYCGSLWNPQTGTRQLVFFSIVTSLPSTLNVKSLTQVLSSAGAGRKDDLII